MTDPPMGGRMYFYRLTMDLEVDRMRWIVRTETIDQTEFEYGTKVPVWYALFEGHHPPARDLYPLFAGSKKIGELYPSSELY
ncbi:MAG: hypothetical protein ACRCU5_13125 [Rhizobiaceae bacterium]